MKKSQRKHINELFDEKIEQTISDMTDNSISEETETFSEDPKYLESWTVERHIDKDGNETNTLNYKYKKEQNKEMLRDLVNARNDYNAQRHEKFKVIASGAATLLGIGIIKVIEETGHLFTSKAVSFIPKPKF